MTIKGKIMDSDGRKGHIVNLDTDNQSSEEDDQINKCKKCQFSYEDTWPLVALPCIKEVSF